MSLQAKLERLLRFHRQRVFDANGDAHHRALMRLKQSATFKAMCRANREAESIRLGKRLTAMGY